MATYKQVKPVNLDPVLYQGGAVLTSWLGWCFAYTCTAFGLSWIAGTAWAGWDATTKGKHKNKDFPTGVYFPMWWSGYQGMGHSAIGKYDGKKLTVWTSPNTHKPTADKLEGTVEDVLGRIKNGWGGVEYVGWSEYIGGVKVIEPIADTRWVPMDKPRKMKVKKAVKKTCTTCDRATGSLMAKGRVIEFAEKRTYKGVQVLRSKYDAEHGLNKGFKRTELEEV